MSYSPQFPIQYVGFRPYRLRFNGRGGSPELQHMGFKRVLSEFNRCLTAFRHGVWTPVSGGEVAL